MKVIIYEPGERGRDADIPNELAALQVAVGGYIETVRLTREVLLLVDEEGLLKDLPYNRLGLRGTIVVCGRKKAEFAGLTPQLARAVHETFGDIGQAKGRKSW